MDHKEACLELGNKATKEYTIEENLR